LITKWIYFYHTENKRKKKVAFIMNIIEAFLKTFHTLIILIIGPYIDDSTIQSNQSIYAKTLSKDLEISLINFTNYNLKNQEDISFLKNQINTILENNKAIIINVNNIDNLLFDILGKNKISFCIYFFSTIKVLKTLNIPNYLINLNKIETHKNMYTPPNYSRNKVYIFNDTLINGYSKLWNFTIDKLKKILDKYYYPDV